MISITTTQARARKQQDANRCMPYVHKHALMHSTTEHGKERRAQKHTDKSRIRRMKCTSAALHITGAPGLWNNNSQRGENNNKCTPPPSPCHADRGQWLADCLALLFGTRRVSMCAFVQMHTACHSWSLATPPTAVLQPAVTDECPHTVWLSDRSVWLTKTGPRAESFSANRHFFFIRSIYCLSALELTSLLDRVLLHPSQPQFKLQTAA